MEILDGSGSHIALSTGFEILERNEEKFPIVDGITETHV
jgi:hypothetical protein